MVEYYFVHEPSQKDIVDIFIYVNIKIRKS